MGVQNSKGLQYPEFHGEGKCDGNFGGKQCSRIHMITVLDE